MQDQSQRRTVLIRDRRVSLDRIASISDCSAALRSGPASPPGVPSCIVFSGTKLECALAVSVYACLPHSQGHSLGAGHSAPRSVKAYASQHAGGLMLEGHHNLASSH